MESNVFATIFSLNSLSNSNEHFQWIETKEFWGEAYKY